MTRDALRVSLMCLVALNLLFIQITGVLSVLWLLPLYALTVLAPWLVRFQERLAYRLAWNVSIMAVLGWLVYDARTRGIAYLLDDGMFLAGACQVHLLNNLRRDQKPDLTFLNSFLIAIVTSYFCQDVQFLIVFVPYAFVLLHAMTIACLQSDQVLPCGQRGWLRGQVLRVGFLLVLTGAAFLTWPRSFDRTGFLANSFDLAHGGVSSTGYTERVSLDRSGVTKSSPAVVFRVRYLEGERECVPLHWRGGTCSAFDGVQWIPEDPPPRAVAMLERRAWTSNGRETWERSHEDPVGRFEVTMERLVAERLFLPETTQRVDRLDGSRPRPDGTIGWKARRAAGKHYRIDLGREAPGTSPRRVDRDVLERYLLLDRSRVPINVTLRREAWRRENPSGRDRRAHVENLRQRVSNLGPYLAPGDPAASRTLDEFVDGQGGHCEFFASALAMFLRLDGIPCRLVTGFLAQEWNDDHTELVVRERHAHAWLEVFDEEQGWYTVDPTPAGTGAMVLAKDSIFQRTLAALRGLWNDLVAFDDQGRNAWLSWMAALPILLMELAWEYPFAAFAIVVALVMLVVQRVRRRRSREPDVVRAYRRALKRAGLVPEPGETPRRLLARAAAMIAADDARYAALRSATDEHERARYDSKSLVQRSSGSGMAREAPQQVVR